MLTADCGAGVLNNQGQLGLGDTEDRAMPTPVSSFDGLFVTCIAANDFKAVATSTFGAKPFSDDSPAVHAPRRLAGPAEAPLSP